MRILKTAFFEQPTKTVFDQSFSCEFRLGSNCKKAYFPLVMSFMVVDRIYSYFNKDT